MHNLAQKMWYRLLKVFYFVALMVIGSSAVVAFSSDGWMASILAGIITLLSFEILRRIFYYIVFGQFFLNWNKDNLLRLRGLAALHSKRIAIVFVMILLIAVSFFAFPVLKAKYRSIQWNEYVYFVKDADGLINKYKKMAENGDAYAQFKLGLAFHDKKDIPSAITWLQKAVDQNEHHAEYLLGSIYRTGEGIKKNVELGIELTKKAANGGNSHGMVWLWSRTRNKQLTGAEKVKNDALIKEAIVILQNEAKTGEPAALYKLGVLFQYGGSGVIVDKERARGLLEDAADKGHGTSQYALGVIYRDGDGVNEDAYRAFSYFQQAAEDENDDAELEIALAYYQGEGVEKDLNKAIEWMIKASEHGSSRAQYFLNLAYSEGNGIAKNYEKSIEWLNKSAEQDYAPAQLKLGDNYLDGDGVKADRNQAKKWWKLAAGNGDADMRYEVARRFWDEPIESYMWYALSAAGGNENAKSAMEGLEYGDMSSGDIKKAQALAASYQE